jgi:spermidine synthase
LSKPYFNTPVILLSLSILFTGATGLVNEYILSTISSYILGNSIEQFSITIAIMMLFMGIGGYIQQFVDDKFLIEKFIFIEIMLAIIGSFAPIAVYAIFGYMENHFNLFLYFFIATIGFLIGFEIPFVARINQQYTKNLKTNIAFIISADYVGAFIGALIWVFLLLPFLHIFKIGFLVSGLNFFIAFITMIYFKKFILKTIFIVYSIIFVVLSLILVYGYNYSEQYDKLIEQKLYEDKVVFSTTTKYQHIAVTHNSTIDDYRLYLNGNLQFSSLDEIRYHEFLVHPAMSLAKKTDNILVLGGGDGLAVKQIQKYKPKNITLIDLDSKMTQIATSNKILQKLNNNAFQNQNIIFLDAKITSNRQKDIYIKNDDNNESYLATVDIYNIDAMNYLNDINNTKFNVVVIDLPDPNSVELSKLYSKEFYLNLKKVINIDTIISIQASSSYFAKEIYLSIGRTIRSANYNTIPYHHNIPSFGEWGFYMFSLNKGLKADLNLQVDTDYITDALFKASLVFGKNDLVTKKTYINTLMNPRLFYDYQRNSWLKY